MNAQMNLLLTDFTRTVPHIVGAILVLVIGYIIAKAIEGAVSGGLHHAGFNKHISSSPGGSMVKRVTESPSKLIGRIAFWVIELGVISLAVSVLGIPALTVVMASIYAYLPNVIAAMLILLVATAVATGLSALAHRLMGDTATGKLITGIAPGLVFSIAIFMALNQLQIAPAIVTITYAAILGSLALGSALAFGLGGREVAARLLESAHSKLQDQADQVQADMALGTSRAQDMVTQAKEQMEPEQQQHPRFNPAPSFGERVDSGRRR